MTTSIAQLMIRRDGSGEQSIQIFPLNTHILHIGRTPDSGLPLPDGQVSRHHAELRMEAQGLMLTDLGSSNGTFIGNQRLLPNQPHLLTDGAIFRIGPFLLTYQAAKAATHSVEEEQVQPTRQVAMHPGDDQAMPAADPVTLEVHHAAKFQAQQPVKPAPRRLMDEPDSIYRHYLPDIFQESDFLKRFLRIFEDIWEPLEQRQDHIAMYFDPQTCPVSFLPWLASWLDFPLKTFWPEARQRDLLAQAMELYRWRGTSYGLIRMIEVCTGLTPVITENPELPFVFHMRITLPPNQTLDKDLIEELILAHKAAHAGYILEVNV